MDIPPVSSQISLSQLIVGNPELPSLNTQNAVFTALIESVKQNASSTGRKDALFELVLNVQGQKIVTESKRSFQPGQTLRIQILNEANIRVLEILPTPVAELKSLLQQGLRESLPLQQNTNILLNNLLQLRPLLLQLPQDPQILAVERQIEQLLQSLPRLEQLQRAPELKSALINSGTFLEAKIQQLSQRLTPPLGTVQGRPNSDAIQSPKLPTPPGNTDLRAAGSRRTESTTTFPLSEQLRNNGPVAGELGRVLASDLKAQLIRLVTTLAPILPQKLTAGRPVAPPTGFAATKGLGAFNEPPGTTHQPAISTSKVQAQGSNQPPPLLRTKSPSPAQLLQQAPAAKQQRSNSAARAPEIGKPASSESRRAYAQPASPRQPSPTEASAASALISRILHTSVPQSASATERAALAPELRLSNTPLNTDLAHILVATSTSSVRDQATMQDRFDLAMSTVLRQLATTLAKIQSNQFTSLTTQLAGDANPSQSWHIEIPVFSEGHFRPLQLIIERDTHHQSSEQSQSKAHQWNITLGFDFEALGEFFATLKVVENSISTTFWSETPQTLSLIRTELQVLENALRELGLEVNELDCRQGKPSLKTSRLNQQLVDIET